MDSGSLARRAPRAVAVIGWGAVAGAGVVMAVIDRRLHAAGRDDLQQLLSAEAPTFVLATLSATLVGSALVVRRPQHPVGWLVLAIGVSVPLAGAAGSYAGYGAVARPGSLPLADLVAVMADIVFVVWLVLLTLLFVVTPTGRPASPRWRMVARASVIGGAITIATGLFTRYELDPPFDGVESPWALVDDSAAVVAVRIASLVVVHVAVIAATFSLLLRFHRARGVERLQLRWLALAAVPLPLMVVAAAVLATTGHDVALAALAGLYLAILPIATGLAVVQYRLYDIERLVSRSITYLLLSALVVAVYLSVVVVVAASAGRVAGRSQTTAVAATLAAVSVALPLRMRVQRAVDRRFSRRQYDALHAVQAFVRDPHSSATIEDTLRTALDDPGLSVAYWVEERGAWFTENGHPVAIRDGIEVRHRDARVALVAFDPARVDRSLVEVVADEARPVLESARLRAAIALQLVEVRESRARIVTAQLAERRTIERNLHDGAQQRLLAVAMQLRAVEMSGDPERALAALPTAIDEMQRAVADLRDLANGLHPALLSDGGLASALDDLAARIPYVVDLEVTPERFSPEVEACAWYITCEAVANAVKHARPSAIAIAVTRSNGRLVVVVDDDGVGGADPSGRGLRGVADRAETAGGELHVEALESGGTRVRAELPCAL